MILGERANIVETDMDDFTKITFYPDLRRLCPNRPDHTEISVQDQQALIKRCVDIAGTAGLKVLVNGIEFEVDGWQQ